VTVKLALALGGLALVFLFHWFSGDQVRRRAIARAPRRRIRDLRDEEVARVVGTAGVENALRAPISGRPCAYFRVVVEEQVQRGGRRHWTKILDEQDGVDFLLEDGTGEALVVTARAEAVLEQDRSQRSGVLRDASADLEAFLRKRGQSSEGFLFNRTLRYREGVVEAGERVAVVGIARRTSKGRVRLTAPPNGALLLSDEAALTG
jgi:hypothetical protein